MANKEYHYAIWRRKETSTVVKLFGKGTGEFTVKTAKWIEKSLQQYFGGNDYLYQNAIAPFTTLGADYLKKFDAQIKIVWWGIAWQSDAIKLAFARALIDWDADLRPTLKPFGHLKRDPRIKERKKPGLKKARKSPTWSKR